MNKINDKLIIGVIAGLGANVIKNIIGHSSMKFGLAELDGPSRATGMLVPPYKIADPKGRFVGFLADMVIAGTLGVVTLGGLSLFGKKHAVIKGALAGAGMWTMLYGIMGTLGATKVNPVSPSTVLSEFLTHTVYGAATAGIITQIADQSVFNKSNQNLIQPPSQQISWQANAAR